MSTVVVIMAGGVGSRFWPMSRRARPKQLLALAPGETRSLLRCTLDRAAKIAPPERTIIVTGSEMRDAICAEAPELPSENVLGEPEGRNTAPCVGWAAIASKRLDPDAMLVVLPADHLIGDEPGYLEVVAKGVEAAARGALVTCGITPTRAETGYGYIEVAESSKASAEEGPWEVARFVEKPDKERARAFLETGRFLWNSGMFFFKASAILAEMERQLPSLFAGLGQIEAAADPAAHVAAHYGELPSISIDHGVMEGARDVRVVPGSFGWSDLGSWTTSWELATKDERGNAASESAILVDVEGTLVRSETERVIALIGLEDFVVIDTDDALLIAPRERVQEVKHVVTELQRRDDPRR